MSAHRYLIIADTGEMTEAPSAEAALAARGPGTYLWFDLVKPSREELLALAKPLGLHPLAIEDCLDDDQIPKLEDFADNTFILFNRYHYKDRTLSVEEIDFFLGRDYLVSVAAHANDLKAHHALEAAVQHEPGALARGPDFLLHVILDQIVDDKLRTIEAVQDDLDHVEESILAKSPSFSPAAVLRLRRELLALRKSLFHEREILVKVCRRDSPFVSEKAIYRFRDIYDHLVKFVEVVEICREMIASLMELHLSLVNNELGHTANRTGEVVRRLTIITTVFMPLSFLAGVGGMSEWSMMTGAENWWFSYPLFLLACAGLGFITYKVLKYLDPPKKLAQKADATRPF